jgi:hypothetical protein
MGLGVYLSGEAFSYQVWGPGFNPQHQNKQINKYYLAWKKEEGTILDLKKYKGHQPNHCV